MARQARISLILVATLSLFGAACSSSNETAGTPTNGATTAAATTAAAVATNSVDAADFNFKPAAITVKAGDTVTWHFVGASPHTVTAADKSYDSKVLNKGATYTHMYATAGTYQYYCTLHGNATGGGMAGTVTVT
ncbi:MAG: plastocyanin/azurin family copper-binding protein [Actinomycetota bacterium]